MIDGIKIFAPLQADHTPRPPVALVDTATGAFVNSFAEVVAPPLYARYYPVTAPFTHTTIYGSLHKYHTGGNNTGVFTFADLSHTITRLEKDFAIKAETAQIQRLEIGVNIPVDFPAKVLLNSLVCYRGKPIKDYYTKYPLVEYRGCLLHDYCLKFYVKEEKVFRAEVVFNRQRPLAKLGICTLADLSHPAKYTALALFLLDCLANCFFFDYRTYYRKKGFTQATRNRLGKYASPIYWENLSPQARRNAYKRATRITTENGLYNYGKYTLEKTTKILTQILPNKQLKSLLFPQANAQSKHKQKFTFSTLEYLCTKVNFAPKVTFAGALAQQTPATPAQNRITETTKNRRFCCVCGREITHQRTNSRFCSEKYFGKSAKQCRNKDSNRRLTLKRKITKAMQKQKYLAVTYRYGKDTYCDILSPSEIAPTTENLNRITEIMIIDQPPRKLKGNKAREYLQKVCKEYATTPPPKYKAFAPQQATEQAKNKRTGTQTGNHPATPSKS
jgi:hypothetical protein